MIKRLAAYLVIGLGLFLVSFIWNLDSKEGARQGALWERICQTSDAVCDYFRANGEFPAMLEDLQGSASPAMNTSDPYDPGERDFVYRRIEWATEDRFELYFLRLESPAIIGEGSVEPRAWKWSCTPEFRAFVIPHIPPSVGEPAFERRWPDSESEEQGS